jgi:hypothetical protein
MPRSWILPRTPTRPSPATVAAPPAPVPLVALLVAALLLVTGCTSNKGDKGEPTTTGQSQTSGTIAAAKTLRIDIRSSAQGPERAFNSKAAAKKATPNMERFLHRYLSVAFLDPAQEKNGWRDLLVLFDGSVKAAAKRDLDSLSLGSDAAEIKSVQPDKAKASVLFFYRGSRPAGATVKLNFEGSAEAEKGTGPVRMESVFQMLSTPQGWRIAAYQSRTGEAG